MTLILPTDCKLSMFDNAWTNSYFGPNILAIFKRITNDSNAMLVIGITASPCSVKSVQLCRYPLGLGWGHTMGSNMKKD